jgi:hypothetical protein
MNTSHCALHQDMQALQSALLSYGSVSRMNPSLRDFSHIANDRYLPDALLSCCAERIESRNDTSP